MLTTDLALLHLETQVSGEPICIPRYPPSVRDNQDGDCRVVYWDTNGNSLVV